jgi:hypothetical protein
VSLELHQEMGLRLSLHTTTWSSTKASKAHQ